MFSPHDSLDVEQIKTENQRRLLSSQTKEILAFKDIVQLNCTYTVVKGKAEKNDLNHFAHCRLSNCHTEQHTPQTQNQQKNK